ncbi:helix-turn-helix transcriptional regulator [Escherichia coli]|uniref:helix-turn-helix transcriptional regulator n=1 Tax=Escherichia coli TaxID=562 RepID=UPI00202DD8AE|nr:helix-turn-helix transcriptional regulator [Escherichia coli]
MNFKNGGQAVITRMLEAYGFKTRQALCEQFNVSASTMGTRWMRDVFPADWVIQCAIETGASIEWLSFGKGVPFPQSTEAPVMSKGNCIKGSARFPSHHTEVPNWERSEFGLRRT